MYPKCVAGLLRYSTTGLGFKQLSSLMKLTEPNVGVYLSPHSFSLATIGKGPDRETTNASSKISGTCGDTAISYINVWAHKKSTLSISMRGLVKIPGIEASWPRCILYLEPCTSANVNVKKAFKAVDSGVSAVHIQLFPNQSIDI